MGRILGGDGDQGFFFLRAWSPFLWFGSGAVAMRRILGAMATRFFPLAGLVAIFVVWLKGCRHGAYSGSDGDQGFSSCGLGRHFRGLAQGLSPWGVFWGSLATSFSLLRAWSLILWFGYGRENQIWPPQGRRLPVRRIFAPYRYTPYSFIQL